MRRTPYVGFAVAVLFLLLAGCASRGGEAQAECTQCGMNAAASKGRFVLDFQDGTTLEACSGHCASMLASRQGSSLYRVRVHGYDTGDLLDGYDAVYVLGADTIPEGSMGPAVFAFSTGEGAGAFIAEHGGRTATLEEILGMTRPGGEGTGGH